MDISSILIQVNEIFFRLFKNKWYKWKMFF